mgnify:FL=1
MNEKREFDALLAAALAEACWQECRQDWEAEEEAAFSPAYLSWRAALLADPFAWARRRLRPVWLRAVRAAACVVLALAVALGSLMAVSPTVRAAVLRWLREITGNFITYSSVEQGDTARYSTRRLTWLPEGWALQDIGRNTWEYRRMDNGGRLILSCHNAQDYQVTTNVDDVADAEDVRTDAQVRGCPADYYLSEDYQVLVWEEARYVFLLRGSGLEEDDFFRAAESVEPYSGADTAYELGWVPAEYDFLTRSEPAGAATEEWMEGGVILTWQYVIDPVCAFRTPEGEPEELTLAGGETAWYWAPTEPIPEEAPAGQDEPIEVGGVVISSGVFSPDSNGTLIWEKDDAMFYLSAPLIKEDLIAMAQRVQETEPSLTPLSGNTMILEGNTGGE